MKILSQNRKAARLLSPEESLTAGQIANRRAQIIDHRTDLD
jgi:hypothetical protein